ncbi:unnamed protein product [Ambrosiozyma monospora]|uniref:Unnamed protein product n=1 Tax=Ambrosiozyma monospora TaxID=43982 RepID=A0ACB5U5C6_AMBMO|nr:unnamed protein product [Ambrosiozyma monospora]
MRSFKNDEDKYKTMLSDACSSKIIGRSDDNDRKKRIRLILKEMFRVVSMEPERRRNKTSQVSVTVISPGKKYSAKVYQNANNSYQESVPARSHSTTSSPKVRRASAANKSPKAVRPSFSRFPKSKSASNVTIVYDPNDGLSPSSILSRMGVEKTKILPPPKITQGSLATAISTPNPADILQSSSSNFNSLPSFHQNFPYADHQNTTTRSGTNFYKTFNSNVNAHALATVDIPPSPPIHTNTSCSVNPSTQLNNFNFFDQANNSHLSLLYGNPIPATATTTTSTTNANLTSSTLHYQVVYP